MQKEDKYTEFDLSVRELLQDAEVKAPRGVWKGVASRIAAPKASEPVFYWRWAGAFAAAAAAIAGIIYVSGGSFESNYGSDEIFAVANMTDSGEQSSHTLLVAQNLEKPRKDAFMAPVNALKASGNASTEATAAVSAEVPVQPAVSFSETNSTVSEAKVPVQTESNDASDVFAAMEAEDNLKSSEQMKSRKDKISLTAGGLFGSNSTEYNAVVSRPHRASGAGDKGLVENTVSEYGIPVSFGLGLKVPITNRFSAGVGAEWSMLTRTFNGSYKTEDGDMTHIMHYVGVPVTAYYDLLKSNTLLIYSRVGGRVDFCASNKYYIFDTSSMPLLSEPVHDPLFSATVGLGAEFNLGKHLGLYLDPGVTYHFNCNQPKSLYTDKPLMFTISMGLRFKV